MEQPLISSKTTSSEATGVNVDEGLPQEKSIACVVALLLSACTLATAAFSLARQSPTLSQVQPVLLNKSFELYTKLTETDAKGNDAQWLQCVTDTGGTCWIWDCDTDRGPTDCTWFQGEKACVCKAGYCSGLDGKCREAPNRVVTQSVRFKNAQWPDYHLYLSAYNLGVTNDPEYDDDTYFNLYELPLNGEPEPSLEHRRFMLGGVHHPSHVAMLQHSQTCEQCYDGKDADNKPQYRDCNCRDQWNGASLQVEKMSIDIIIKFANAYSREPAVTIESLAAFGYKWYIPQSSYAVASMQSDPGPQGYWIPDKPIPGLSESFSRGGDSLDGKANGQVRVAEKKIDPQNGQAYTYKELSDYYADTYTADEIQKYWDNTCTPEKKIDPKNGQAYTYKELSSYYADTYTADEIQEYWDETCTPV